MPRHPPPPQLFEPGTEVQRMTDDTGVEARTGQDRLTLAVEGDVPVGHRLREVLDGTSDAAGTSVSAMTWTPKNLSYRLSIAHCKIISSVLVIERVNRRTLMSCQ
jgi:hypothetical protein